MRGRGRHRRRERPRRRWLLTLLLVAVVLLVGATRAGEDSGRTVGRPTPVVPEPQWPDVLAALDGLRTRAFGSGDLDALAAVYAPGSPAGDRDARLLRALVAARQHTVGLGVQVLEAAALRRSPDTVTLRVVDRMPAYRLVDDRGRTVARRAARPPRAWTIDLRRVAGRWLVDDVAAA